MPFISRDLSTRRYGVYQSISVRVQRISEEDTCQSLLHYSASVKDVGSGGKFVCYSEVVSDQQEADLIFPREFLEKVNDFSLRRNVESGRRLVGNQELWIPSRIAMAIITLCLMPPLS